MCCQIKKDSNPNGKSQEVCFSLPSSIHNLIQQQLAVFFIFSHKMTNVFFLVGLYIIPWPMCLCLTNRLCVLKQPRMAQVMTNCINKTFITLNILATKSQLLQSTSEHPVPLPHSYSSHTMLPMHKLALFCHIGGLEG